MFDFPQDYVGCPAFVSEADDSKAEPPVITDPLAAWPYLDVPDFDDGDDDEGEFEECTVVFDLSDGQKLDMKLEPANMKKGSGVKVKAITEDGQADKKKVRAGWKIIAVNGFDITKVKDLRDVVGHIFKGTTNEITF